MNVTNAEVLNAMFRNMGRAERAVLCSLAGDPSTAEGTAWNGTPWALGDACPLRPERNNYVAISSFSGRRRRKEDFRALHAVMVDDLGTKVPVSGLPQSITPSMVVETSPKNYQATFFLDAPQTDADKAQDAIRQIIERVTGGGADPGMAGVTRVLRLPQGINGKPKYGGWSCRMVVWRPDKTTTWGELCHAFGAYPRVRQRIEPPDAVARERERGYGIVMQGMDSLGLVKREGKGWIDIRCPWLHEHTDRADSGSAVSAPNKKNGWYGGFKCHHGHCESRTWGDLAEQVGRMIYTEGKRTHGDFE